MYESLVRQKLTLVPPLDMQYANLASYDVNGCAQMCDQLDGCQACKYIYVLTKIFTVH